MAITLFYVEVGITGPGPSKSISLDAKDVLFRKPTVKTTKPKEAGALARSSLQEEEIEDVTVSLTLEELATGYGELIEMAESTLVKLKGRVGNLTYFFSPQQEPVLSEAVSSIFQNVNDRITYEMYLSALRLDKDLAIQLGEAEHGIS